ncbi:MAG TPA: alpha/beta fold hydrolase [Pyrinomonadaceae bacterium]|nr:alpha/beta fold hydrolase [Pyrinomonadaceae bacterium]
MRSLRLGVVGLLLALVASGASGVVRAQGETAKPAQTPTTKPAQSPVNPAPTPDKPAPAPERAAPMTPAVSHPEPLVLETPDGKLYGTLEVPTRGKAPYPVVLIISGSGATDRDGNIGGLPGGNNSLKYLAEGLAAEGIASLRYDKRGVAESRAAMKDEASLSFETYIIDATLWAKRLREDRRFSQLFVAGHSEGSLIGMVAAERAGADGYASLEGPGRRIDVLLLEQVKPQFPPELYKQTEDILKSLAEGKTVTDFPPNLAPFFRQSVQPYLISWLKYDPAVEIAKLKTPVLIVQGTSDWQVTAADAQALARAKPDAKLVTVEGMNHVLKLTPADRAQQGPSYADPSLPVADKLITEFVAFVKGIKKK